MKTPLGEALSPFTSVEQEQRTFNAKHADIDTTLETADDSESLLETLKR